MNLNKSSQLALRAVLLYCLISGVWILFSDRVLAFFVADPVWLTQLQSVKGLIFVAVTAVFFYAMLRNRLREWEREAIERAQTEVKLRDTLAEAQRFREALDRVPVYIYMKDPQSRYLYANRLTLRLFHCSAEELVGCDDTRFFPPETARRLQQIDARVFRGEQTAEEIDVPDAVGGRRVYWEVKIPLYTDAEKKTLWGLLGISTDITGRKQAEERLQDDAMRLRVAISVADIAVFEMDRDLRYTWMHNPQLGYASNQVLGRTDVELLGEDGRTVMDIKRRALESKKGVRKEVPLKWDGKDRIFHLAVDPILSQTGEVTGLRGASADITAHKAVEASHARLATAVEQAAETIIITDLNGTILYANPAFQRTSGYTCAEAVGQNPRVFKSGKHDAAFYRQMWDVLKRGEVWTGHFINRRKNGTLYKEEATISPIRNAAGTIVSYVAVKRDVTREMDLEAQIRQAQKMEVVGRLAGGVAHDFNNILAVIQMVVELMKTDEKATPELLAYAKDIGVAAERAASLTRQLLLFGRKEILLPRDLDLNDGINNLAKMLRRVLGEDIQLQFQFATVPLFVHADPGMMDQVLMNLAVNSRDAMPNGGKLIIETSAVQFDELSATQTPQARPGSFACLAITDTGCGIPTEDLPRIFEPFFTTKGVGKGTGLGLAIVYGVVQQHHGWVNVYSEAGRGATFRIYLPRLVKPAAQEPEAAPAAPFAGGHETILLVEDDALVCASLRKVLAKFGYNLFIAANAVEALEIWEQHRDEIQLVLTDLVMPGGMNGKELAEQLLKDKPGLKIIYASGYSAEVAGRDLPLQEGVNYISKPFQPQKLAQTIRARLNG